MTATASKTLLEHFADYAEGERTARLSDEVRHHAKRALIDWFGALMAGANIEPATLVMKALKEEVGHGNAIIYGTGRRATTRAAAKINGIASHTVEFDDIFRDAIYHPGCPTISAALAMAHTRRANGEALLRAIVVGYEISTRIGVAVQPSHYRFWHSSGTIGTFGAAAGVAMILKLNRTAIVHALATAGTSAAALQQAFRSHSMSKPLHVGHAADAGVVAGLCAEQGVTGAPDILEGKEGFGAAMSQNPDWAKALDGLGNRYNITSMTVKNHGCCGHCFASIDAVLELRRAHNLTPDRIKKVTVKTYQVALDATGRKVVNGPFEGRFSTPYTIAVALIHGSVRLKAFEDAQLKDPGIKDMMQRVDMVLDPKCEAGFPKQRSAIVEIETTDGKRYEHYQATRKGDPDAPLTDDELSEKYFELAGPVIGRSAAESLIKRIWALDQQADVEFGEALAAA